MTLKFFSCLIIISSICAAALFQAVPAHPIDPGSTTLRVAVFRDRESLDIRIDGPSRIEALNTGELLDEADAMLKAEIKPTVSGILLGNKEYKLSGIRFVPQKDSSIYVNDRRFRGIMDVISVSDKGLLAINHVDVEDYLYGVLYHEVSHLWPLDALKAQAVAARTYALYRKKEAKALDTSAELSINPERSRRVDYDLTSDVYSQVYGGRTSERRVTNRAVDDTAGEVLVYKGSLFPAYFHAACGSRTEDADKVWKINIKPLKGHRCGYCFDSPHFSWKASFSYRQMEERLNKYGIPFTKLSFIAPGKRDASGRLTTVKLRDSSGVKAIPANTFRLALGPGMIKSTNFTFEIEPSGIKFKGFGWGHGVGMCQWGALGMAKKKFNYREILSFYYPGSSIKQLP